MEKVIIRSLRPLQRDYLMATINYKDNPPEHATDWAKKHAGKTFHITQDFQVYEARTQKDEMPAWSLRMGESGHLAYFIQWDEKSDKATDKNRALAVKHLCYQNKMKPLFGEINTNAIGDPFFSIEYEGTKNTYLADLNDKKFAVYKKFRKLSPSEKRDCAFYYGLNATGMRHSELISKMADFETGKLMLTTNKIDGMPIQDHFINKYGQEHITQIKMIAEKAIVYGQISKNDKGYYINQEFIGTTVENVYDYLSANKQIQDFLSTQIANIDRTVEDDMEEREEKELIVPKNLDDIEKWRELGVEAGVKLARVCGIDTIKERLVLLAQKKGIDHTQEPEKIAKELIAMKSGLVTA